MAQETATPKLRRLKIRLARALSLRMPPLQASEIAALALRQARDGQELPIAEEVLFLIPLVGPGPVKDWSAVTDRLQGTLNSLIAQNNPHWRAVICCQELPPLPDDPRIRHLPFDDPAPGNDKWRKLSALCSALPDIAEGPSYVMSFDADDLLRQGTVEEMLSRQKPGGYLVETGYVLDHATGDAALSRPRTLSQLLQKPFWKLCGSCVALRVDPEIPEGAAFLKAMTAHEHRMFPYLARLAGQKLSPLRRPSVLYVLNHGENFGARRGRVSFKTRFVQRFRLTDQAHLDAIQNEFPTP